MRVQWIQFLTLAIAVGCGGDSTTEPNADIIGTYSLESVGGRSLPASVGSAGVTIERGSIRIAPTFFAIRGDTGRIGTSPLSTRDSLVYARNGDQILFTTTLGSPRVDGTATLSGSTLTVNLIGGSNNPYVYRRR